MRLTLTTIGVWIPPVSLFQLLLLPITKEKIMGNMAMLGPIESIVVGFPGNKFKGELMPALQELTDKKLIKIIDFVVVVKDAKGDFQAAEWENFDKKTTSFFNKLGLNPSHLISEEDVHKVGHALDNSSSAVMVMFEHLWFKNLSEAIVKAKGVLISDDHLPVAAIEQALKALQEASSKSKKKAAAPKK